MFGLRLVRESDLLELQWSLEDAEAALSSVEAAGGHRETGLSFVCAKGKVVWALMVVRQVLGVDLDFGRGSRR